MSLEVGEVEKGFLEHDQHLLLIDLVVPVEVGVLDELFHLHEVDLAFLSKVVQRVLEQVHDLEVLQPAVAVYVVFLEDLLHCLPQVLLRNIHLQL